MNADTAAARTVAPCVSSHWRAFCLFLVLALTPAHAQQMLLDAFDPSPDGRIITFTVQDDGVWLVAGEFTRIAGAPRPGLARFLADGTLDAAFSPDAVDGSIFSILVLPDGKLMVGGNFTRIGDIARSGLARLHADGRLDLDFPDLRLVPLSNHAHHDMVYRITRQRDGKLLIAGCFTDIADSGIHALARLHPDGRIDAGFTPITAQSINPRAYFWDVREQADGRLLLAGGFYELHGAAVAHLARLLPDGRLDTGFTPAVRRPGGGGETRVAIEQADGRIVVGGRFDQVIGSGQNWNTPLEVGNLVRLHPDGSIDYGYSDSGASTNAGISWLALQPDQRVLIGGAFSRTGTSPLMQQRDKFARFLPSGTPDTTLPGRGAGSDGQANAVAALPDGRILIGGTFSHVLGTPRRHLARLSPAEPLRGIHALALGHHTCALADTLRCWGDADEVTASIATTLRTLSAGHAHTCALTQTGDALCWGRNREGQLGDGSHAWQAQAAPVAGLPANLRTLAAGHAHTCAVTAEGRALCWGDNTYGQLGDGSTASRAQPVPVVGLASNIATLAAGHSHTCALTTEGQALCWGRNWQGELGDGTATARSTPIPVASLGKGVRAIAAGYVHTCAVDAGGAAQCWGRNANGQLGDGSTQHRLRPTRVAGIGNNTLRSIHAGRFHTCALDEAGAARCWGGNRHGQLGDGYTADRTTPTPVHGLGHGTRLLATGDYHTCAVVDADDTLLCWGWNDAGQLGDGGTVSRATPAPARVPRAIAH